MSSPVAMVLAGSRPSLALGAAEAGVLVGKGALAAGVSFGIGELYVRRNHKWYGRHAPWLFTAAGKGLAALVQIFTMGQGGAVADVLDFFGQAGAHAVGLSAGLDHARGAVPALPGKTAVGALPPAAAGRAMTWDQLEEVARMA